MQNRIVGEMADIWRRERSATGAPVSPISANQRQQILDAVSNRVKLPSISSGYLTSLFFTAMAMWLLPLIYLSLVVLAVGYLCVFVRYQSVLLAALSPVWKTVVSSIILFSGCSLILALLKPIFPAAVAKTKMRTLRREAEPFLYEFVDQLCDAIGARRPTDIHITWDVNAGAEFRRGWLSFFSNRDISLHLGLPLLSGLTLKQLTGVLAHEFGHFTQRTAMWLGGIVLQTNAWFIRAAYEQDLVDRWLIYQCHHSWLLALPCYVARFFIWCARRVLIGLALLGTTVSCLMSREMEYNADLCEIKTVGAKSHALTLIRLRELSMAYQITIGDMAQFFEEGRLPDDLGPLVVSNIALITPAMRRKLVRILNEQTTGTFDTHPSDRDRILAGRLDGSAGAMRNNVLLAELPASALFNRFEELSKSVTSQFYQSTIKQRVRSDMIFPVSQLLERQNAQTEAHRALKRYFQTEIPVLRPLPIWLQSFDANDNLKEIATNVKRCREAMLKELPEYQRLSPRYQAADEVLMEVVAAEALLQANLSFNPADFRVAEATAKCIAEKQKRAQAGIQVLAQKLLPFETEAGHRLSFALQLLQSPTVAGRITDGEDLRYDVLDLLPHAAYASQLMSEMPTLRLVYLRLVPLVERVRQARDRDQLLESIANLLDTIRRRLVSIQNNLGDRLYPFDHARAETTLRDHLLPIIPPPGDLAGLVQAVDRLQSRLVAVQMRLFARLARAAEKVETVLGLPKLPDPNQKT